MVGHRFVRAAGSVGMSGALLGALLLGTAAGVAASSGTVYVSTTGSSSHSGASCGSAKYSSINAGIAAAPAGGKVVVCAGSYHESVAISKALELEGRHAVVNATGFDNGIYITHSWVEVEGFVVWGAQAEGILAQGTPMQISLGGQQVTTGTPVTHVSINHNVVKGNDQGQFNPNTKNPECKAQGEVPGDCGEGIHLWSAAWSHVYDNFVTGNSGGILLTDEFGPNHDNLVENNAVVGNLYDCGITVPSHNVGINPATGQLLPTIAGVYHNTIRRNFVAGNGTKGEGAGILIASPAPVTAAYNNTVEENFIVGNGLPGVTVHTHAPGAYINGNRIIENWIGRNNLLGDPPDTKTTGIDVLVASPATITIRDNSINHDEYGIFLSAGLVTAHGLDDNHFHDVGTPIVHG